MPRRREELEIMPQSPGYPQLIDEPVKPGPKPEEDAPGPAPGMADEIEGPPLPPDAMQPGAAETGIEEGQLPESAAVLRIEGKMVSIVDDMGEERRIPLDSFPVEPREGMLLSRAIVADKGDGKIYARVADEQGLIEIPENKLEKDFEIGDFFWMPEPPAPPEGMREEADED